LRGKRHTGGQTGISQHYLKVAAITVNQTSRHGNQ